MSIINFKGGTYTLVKYRWYHALWAKMFPSQNSSDDVPIAQLTLTIKVNQKGESYCIFDEIKIDRGSCF